MAPSRCWWGRTEISVFAKNRASGETFCYDSDRTMRMWRNWQTR
ncbi:hypothetical protein [Funiculus sociatus]